MSADADPLGQDGDEEADDEEADDDGRDDDGRDDDRPDDDGEGKADGPAEHESASDGAVSAQLVERVVVASSVVLIAAMLGYVLWQAAVAPAAVDPSASVEAVEPIAGSDRERVTVALANDGNVGLASVTVVVTCGDRDHALEFSHVPGNGEREGTVVCPAGSTPRAFVDTWIEA